ncbi:uncharacterized protein LOC144617928 [Crassostrea virginica]
MITENTNGDICVSDWNAKTVTMVDRTGRVRFRYDGTPTGIKKSFDPIGIVTDSLSQIIVSDFKNDCIHIIDKNGKFLKCVENCGLHKPWILSVDSEGRLWVALAVEDAIKVIKDGDSRLYMQKDQRTTDECAMDTPTFLAQKAVFCDLCDNPAVRFCNACQANLCLDCVSRHRAEFESLPHDHSKAKRSSYCYRSASSMQVRDVRRVVCVGLGEAWIIGYNKFIKRIDTRGSVQETVATTDSMWPDDISVTRQEEVIYIENSSRTVKIVRQGQIETVITTPQGWSPWRLCCTNSRDILINEGSYMFPRWIIENSNGDICISDLTADKVVAVTRSGGVRFRYNGTAAKRKAPFSPRSIVIDSRNHIIVADCNNDCLHILDQSGNFLRGVDSCGLDKPGGLTVDREGMLCVALSKAKKIKIIII